MTKQKDSVKRNGERNGKRNGKRNAKPKTKPKEIEKTVPLGENIVRNIANFIQPYIQPAWGVYYGILHMIIMCFGAIVLLFDTNIYDLTVLLNIVALDAMSCVFLHNCPLTILERKHLGTSIVGTRMFLFQNMKICYTCDHEYEITLEFLSNIAALIVGKIFLLIMSKLFSIEFTVSFATSTL
jgi:hypothetical protein